jgi:hypothetical protein
MPTSFNVMEAFHEYVPELSMFRLLREVDHLLSFVEFLDYATSSEAPDGVTDVLGIMEDRVIYSYNVLNDPGDITFSISSGNEYGIGGAALVRHGAEVSILLLAGQKADLNEQTRLLREAKWSSPPPGREWIKPDEDRVREAVPLLGNQNFWQTTVLARLDLEDMTLDVRYVMPDCGNAFMVETDDMSAFLSDASGDFIDARYEETAKSLLQRIEQYGTLFELCKTVLLLPLFYDQYAEEISTERHPTRLLGRIKKRGKPKTKIKYISQEERITHRLVSVLRLATCQHPVRTFHKAPEFKVEVSGFWKKLPQGQVGTDKRARPIHGRTWVEKTLTWVESEEDPGGIVSERHTTDPAVASRGSEGSTKGHIYVMRSAAHEKDIFKVGVTQRTADMRSDELSRTSGSPDKFLVVQEWEVTDCFKAEAVVHKSLAQYRINPNREFFKAPYRVIMSAIEAVLSQVDCDSPQH